MYASIPTGDPEFYVKVRLTDSPCGEVQLTLGSRTAFFLSPVEAEQIVSALTAALQQLAVAA